MPISNVQLGYSSALSKVKSLLTVYNDCHIILLLDAETVSPDKIKEKNDFINYYINSSNRESNFKTIWAIPEMEIVLLNNKKFVVELLGKELSDDLLVISRNSPKNALERLSHKNKNSFLSILDNKDVQKEFFNSDGPIKEIYNFINNEAA